MNKELENAVAAWVRAEYHFRLGPTAFGPEEAEWFDVATRRLRRALTGRKDLRGAFKAIGGKEREGPTKGKHRAGQALF